MYWTSNTIQSLQHQKVTKSTDAVEIAFHTIETEKLDYAFLTLQTCIENIMLLGGSISYEMTHMNREKFRSKNGLPQFLLSKPELFYLQKSV